MQDKQFDMIVIGGGPGGYVAAIRGSQLGLSVACIEREHLGGICLNWGCIPTKAMLRSAEVLYLAQRGREFGLDIQDAKHDLPAIVRRSRKIAKQLSGGVEYLLKKNKVTVIAGSARLVGDKSVKVEGKDGTQTLSAEHIVLATGARARELTGLEPDGARVWSYKHALQPPHEPKKLLVIGSGAIGIEFASFYNVLGADTTVVEISDRILPAEDAEVSAFAKKAFEKASITFHEKASVTDLERYDDHCVANINVAGEEMSDQFDTVISAVGIVGNVEDLGLEEAGVKTENTHVVTDEMCKTTSEGIYAIGDLTGAPWLAHKASHEGVLVAEMIAGNKPHPVAPDAIAGCTYSTPQIASVGLTEAEATSKGYKIRVGRFPLQANGKAIALGEPNGFVKTIFDQQTDALLGAHLVGPEVTELIQGYVVGREAGVTGEQFMSTVFPHPTLSEAMHESVLDAFDRAIHF